MTNDITYWARRRGTIKTRRGGWIPGETVYNQGYSLYDDLIGERTFFQVLFLNVVGRLPEPRLAEWLEARFLLVSWPDHRIWCNHIGSLAGTLQASPIAAVSAGILASDSRLYGPGTLLNTTRFLCAALDAYRHNQSVETIVEQHVRRRNDTNRTPIISGFNRPIAKGDDRIALMERIRTKLGFPKGDHLRLAFAISHYLSTAYEESMNVGAYICAFMCDQGVSGMEHYRMCSTVVHLGVLSCYIETHDDSAGSFFPLRCDDIDYQGKTPRSLV